MIRKLCFIYSQNHNNKNFLNNLHNFLTDEPSLPMSIMGGWNDMYSTYGGNSNSDIFNISNDISKVRSGWLKELYASHNLADPYLTFTSRDETSLMLPLY